MQSNPSVYMEASDLPLGEDERQAVVGGTQEVQSEMEDVVERRKRRRPEVEATAPWTIVLASLSNEQTNEQTLLRKGGHLG